MRCPIQERLAQSHISSLNRARTAEFWEDVLRHKALADAAWKSVVEHRRQCDACRRTSAEAESSAGVPAFRSGVYS